MDRTVAVLNQKGGVGKTTVTLGVASAAANAGQRVLVVDLDPQGSASWVLGVDPGPPTAADMLGQRSPHAADFIVASSWSTNVDVLPGDSRLQGHEHRSNTRLRDALGEVESDYAAVLIDCPPSLGNLTRNALNASRHALLVVEPSALGLRGIGGVADLVDDVWGSDNPDLELTGVILNRVPAVSSEAARRIDELTQIVGREAVWSPAVPQRVILNQAVGERQPIHAFGSRASDAIDAFDALWRKLRRSIGVRQRQRDAAT